MGKHQDPLSGLQRLARRIRLAGDLQIKICVPAGGVVPIAAHGLHSQHLAGDDPVEKSACIILSGIIDPLLPHLRDLDLQDGEVIGDVLIVINAGVGAVNVHLIKCGQRRELRTVPPGKAHGGLTADDAPALLGGLLQKLVGFVCGANILVYYVAAGHQLPFLPPSAEGVRTSSEEIRPVTTATVV